MTEAQPLILIVDDDYDFLEINRRILQGAGYRVACAAAPAEALEKMRTERPDLIISDLMMSSVDSGFAFSRAVKDEPAFSGIPIIISTSVTSQLGLDFRPRSEGDLRQMRVDAYFDKPLDPAALLAKVEELLAGATGRDDRSPEQ